MTGFTALEHAVLRSIFSETPELAATLDQQLEQAKVTERQNSGAGFFTTIAVCENAPRLESTRYLGRQTHASVDGLEHGLGFVLFLEDGRLHLLEGYSYEPESTTSLDLASVAFRVFRAPVNDGS
jgi:hypothetical protein